MFQLVQAQDGLGPWVNRDQGVICCLNGNEGCLREDITVILPCVMFLKEWMWPLFPYHRFLLLHLWGMGIRVNGLQSASALLLTASAYMQKDKKQHIDQCAHVFLSFFQFFFCLSPLSAPLCNWTCLRERDWQSADIPVAVQPHLFLWLFRSVLR